MTSIGRIRRAAAKSLRCLVHPLHRSALLGHRIAAAVEHTPVLLRTAAATVIDIGANKGQFALAAIAALPQCEVISFEPLDGEADRFERALRGRDRVRLHRLAIGESDGTATLHVSARPDSSSLLPIGAMQSSAFPGTQASGRRDVRIARLNSILSPPRMRTPVLLKIDVQGYELRCLRGCDELLDLIEWVYVECSLLEFYVGQHLACDVIEHLSARGFDLDGIHHVTPDREGRVLQADFLFRRRRRT